MENKEQTNQVKTCNKCLVEKPTTEFYKTRTYFQSSCKVCMNASRLLTYVKKPRGVRKPRSKQENKYDRLTEEQKTYIKTSLASGVTMKDISDTVGIKYTTFVKYKNLFTIN